MSHLTCAFVCEFLKMNVGSEVRLQTAEGTFTGIVHALNRQDEFVTLRDGNSYSHF